MIVPRLTCPWASWVQKAPSIQTVAQTLDSSGRSRVPDRRRWPCGRSTRACFAAVTTCPPSGVKKLSRSGPSRSTSVLLGPASRSSSCSVKVRAGNGAAVPKSDWWLATSGRPGPSSGSGRRRGSGRGWLRAHRAAGSVRAASACRASSAVVAAGWSARNTPKNPLVQVPPGASTTGSVCSATALCSPCTRVPGSSALRPGHGAPSARPRPVSWITSVAQRRAVPRHPTSSHGRRAGHVLPDGDRGAVAGHLDRGEVEVLADVVLAGAHRAEGRQRHVLDVDQVDLGRRRPAVRHADVPEPGGLLLGQSERHRDGQVPEPPVPVGGGDSARY